MGSANEQEMGTTHTTHPEVVKNPAYGGADDEIGVTPTPANSVGDDADTDAVANAARLSEEDGKGTTPTEVEALRDKLARMKQTRGEYAARRVATELQKAQEQHSAELSEARERSAAVEAELRAQLARAQSVKIKASDADAEGDDECDGDAVSASGI